METAQVPGKESGVARKTKQGKRKQPGGKKKGRGMLANQRAREATAGLIDHRLRKALSHELRVQILAVANEREISPSQFSREFDVPLSNVSYHFRELVKFDCIELVRKVPARGSFEHRYVGSRRGIIADGDWRALGKGAQAGIRIAGFQDLITRCTQAVAAETFDSREDATFYWVGGNVDEIGWGKLQKSIRRLIREIEDSEVESAQRAADGEGETFPTTFGVLGFESPKPRGRKRRKREKAVKGTQGTE
jgi:DNA-binding transcriptional ArsR family regulator